MLNVDIFLLFQCDIHELYVKMRNMQATNNTMDLLQFYEAVKEKNYKFQYAFTTEEEKRLEHIFWSPHCIDWYQKYEDVVIFYTTSR